MYYCCIAYKDYLDDPEYEGKCENNGYQDTGIVCLNGGFCWNPPLGNILTSACLCCYGYTGKTCEIPPTAASIIEPIMFVQPDGVATFSPGIYLILSM